MQLITLEQAATFFGHVTIEQTIDTGATITHICNAGTANKPCRYVFINETTGESSVSPDFFK
ncbi:MAG: hypothetical protein P4L91_07615 [Burkholderiaceae bacterium]|nr:hypothetical protein [Burkholderiaceae bacterium]